MRTVFFLFRVFGVLVFDFLRYIIKFIFKIQHSVGQVFYSYEKGKCSPTRTRQPLKLNQIRRCFPGLPRRERGRRATGFDGNFRLVSSAAFDGNKDFVCQFLFLHIILLNLIIIKKAVDLQFFLW